MIDLEWVSNSEWEEHTCPWRVTPMESEAQVVVHPEIHPEEPSNLAYHVGELKASHDSLRQEWDQHREEIQQLKALHQTLLDELQSVEAIAEEIQAEDTSVEESASVADPVHQEPTRRDHWLTRGLRGH